MDIEDAGQSRHMEQVAHSFVEISQLELTTFVPNCGVGLNQLPHARAVDIVDLAQVQNYLLILFLYQLAHDVAQHYIAFT